MNAIEKIREKYAGDRFFNEVFENEDYKEALEIGPVDTVLDVGALAGEFSFYIYNNAKRIFALEPEPKEYQELESNVSDNGLSKIKTFNLALSDENGEGFLQLGVRGGHTMLGKEIEGSVPVKTITLTSFLKENKIESVDIMKIDIESYEDTVFMSPDIDEGIRKVKFMIGEHGNLDIIKNLGFEVKKEGTIWTAKRI